MSTILEAVMMICFGFSWPMNLVKNYQSRTAKSMSLPFILLLIAGYTAGIVAKVMLGQMNWVLVIYLINLAMILMNLCVYFRNKTLDRQGIRLAVA
ncbi:MAG: hypothetical protein IJ512_02535 [Ruminococcus sp.]|nr:hypothetical protein [Ruminococcus sp.]